MLSSNICEQTKILLYYEEEWEKFFFLSLSFSSPHCMPYCCLQTLFLPRERERKKNFFLHARAPPLPIRSVLAKSFHWLLLWERGEGGSGKVKCFSPMEK